MGGRSGPSASRILGPGGRGRKRSPSLERKLAHGSSSVVAIAAFQASAVTNPVIGAAYAAYEAAKFTYPIVKKGIEEYRRTGDRDRAIEKMGEETAKQVGRTIVENAVGSVVSSAVDEALRNANIKADETATTFVKAAVAETINRVIE